jgi:hypothetical protein
MGGGGGPPDICLKDIDFDNILQQRACTPLAPSACVVTIYWLTSRAFAFPPLSFHLSFLFFSFLSIIQ